jgi:hypothetical protein
MCSIRQQDANSFEPSHLILVAKQLQDFVKTSTVGVVFHHQRRGATVVQLVEHLIQVVGVAVIIVNEERHASHTAALATREKICDVLMFLERAMCAFLGRQHRARITMKQEALCFLVSVSLGQSSQGMRTKNEKPK